MGAGSDSRYSGAKRGIGAPRGCGEHFGGIRGVGVYWWLAGTVGTQGLEGV